MNNALPNDRLNGAWVNSARVNNALPNDRLNASLDVSDRLSSARVNTGQVNIAGFKHPFECSTGIVPRHGKTNIKAKRELS
jgi:hypothetical protein